MHETIFAKSVLRNVKDVDNVKSLDLELGELVGITKEDLTKGIKNLYPKIEIIIEEIESECECNCGYKGKVKILQRLHDIVIYGCPKCNEQPKVTRGNNIKIKKIIYKN